MKDPLEHQDFDARRALTIVLILVFGAVALGAWNPNVLGTVGVIFGIILMIMIHEGGHYLTAKWSDMKVTEYFLGFGPRLWSYRKGETEYGVKAIPAGGYVRIIGMHNLEEVPEEDEDRTYRQKPYRNRLMVAVAGSFTHFVMAIGMLIIIYAAFGLQTAQPEVESVGDDTPAASAGLRQGDRIVAIDGQPMDDFEAVRDFIRPRAGQPLTVTIERADEVRDVAVTPAAVEEGDETVGQIGFRPRIADETVPLPTAAKDAVVDTGVIARESLEAVGRFFTPSSLGRYGEALTGDVEPADDSRFLSPVGATQVASQAVDEGIREVLLFLVLINIFVGTFNMMPLPPLDGGHVAVATYEKVASMVKGRRVQVDMTKIMPIAALVVTLLLFIGLSALWLDIVRPVDVGF